MLKEEGRGKKEEGRGKKEEGPSASLRVKRGKKEEGRISANDNCQLSTVNCQLSTD